MLASLKKVGLLMKILDSLERQYSDGSLSCKKRCEDVCPWVCICLKLIQEGYLFIY